MQPTRQYALLFFSYIYSFLLDESVLADVNYDSDQELGLAQDATLAQNVIILTKDVIRVLLYLAPVPIDFNFTLPVVYGGLRWLHAVNFALQEL